eukprot:9971878-Alexandrium_andersonii.AAC.1
MDLVSLIRVYLAIFVYRLLRVSGLEGLGAGSASRYTSLRLFDGSGASGQCTFDQDSTAGHDCHQCDALRMTLYVPAGFAVGFVSFVTLRIGNMVPCVLFPG